MTKAEQLLNASMTDIAAAAVRRELMTIRFGGDRQSQNAQIYLQGFLHCAFYYGGMITPERYELITAMAENAAEHRNNVNVRIAA